MLPSLDIEPAAAAPMQGPSVDIEGGSILIGQRVQGVIDSNSDADVYQFQGVAGESVRIEVNTTSGALDPAVTLFLDASRFFPRPPSPAHSLSAGMEVFTQSFAEDLAQQGTVFVDITAPPDGSTIPIPANPTNIQLSGKAGVTGTGVPTNLEVCIVLDVSGSVDDQEHSLQVAGVRAILAALDPDGDGLLTSSVALVQFHTTAAIVVPLTRSRAQIESGLARIGSGSTNYWDALEKALQALAPSSATDNIAEMVLFFSDGEPNTGGDYRAPGGPLERFRPAGIRIDTFGIGTEVRASTLIEIAQATGGTFTAIPTFADVPRVTASLPGVVGLQSVVIDTTGDDRGDVTANVGVDGSFTATVPCRVGRNVYTAIATATNPSLPAARDTITVFGQLRPHVGSNIGVIHDDNSGPGNNALINVIQLPVSGRYLILVASSRSASSGGYELILSPIDKNSNAVAIGVGNEVRIHSTQTGAQALSLGLATFLGFSPSGETAAIGVGNEVRILNTQTGNQTVSLGLATFLAYSPDGEAVAIRVGNDVRIHNALTGQQMVSLGSATFLGFSPTGEMVAVAVGTDVRVHNTRTGAQTVSLGSATFLGFSPEGETAAIGVGADVRVHNARTGAQVISLGSATFLGFSPDGEAVAFGVGTDVRIHNTRTGAQVISLAAATFLGFSPDGQSVAVGVGRDVRIHNVQTGQQVLSLSSATFLGFSPDGDTAAIGVGTDVRIHNTRTGQQMVSLGSATFSAFSPDGETVVMTVGGDVRIHNVQSGAQVLSLGSATFQGFSPDSGAVALRVGNDVRIHNARTGGQTVSLASATFLAFSPDGQTAAIGVGTDVRIHNTRTGQQVVSLGSATFLGFSPEGETVAIGVGTDVRIHNTRSGQQVVSLGSATFQAFSPDGETVAIRVGTDVRIHNARTGQQMVSLGSATFVAFSLDGDAVAIAVGTDVRVHNTRTGAQTVSLGSATFLAFSFDHTRGPSGGQGLNDLCINAREITRVPFTETLDTTRATRSDDDPLQSCTGSLRNSNSVWYRFTPSTSGTVTADTAGSNYDTVLSAHIGSCGALSEVACDDDSGPGLTSQIRFEAIGGRAYFFMVTSFGSSSGGGTLVFNLQFAPRGQRIIRVAQRGGGDFASVQTAIDAARQGDIVEIIDSETYRENLLITTNDITVRAAQGRTPVIDGSSREGHAIEINGATGVTIERLTIRGATGGGVAGVRARNGASATLINNVITSNTRGVSVSASQVILRNNRVENNRGTGIIFFTGSSGFIEGNTIQNNNDNDPTSPFDRGIELQNLAQTMEIRNNTISGNASHGVIIFSSNVTLTGNTISGNVLGILATLFSSSASGSVAMIRSNTIENHQQGGILLLAQTSGEITANKILNNNDRNASTFFDRGIELVNTAGEMRIQNNEITGNGNQGVIIFSTRARLINNLIANNTAGVVLNASSDTPTVGAQVSLINNTVALNRDLGVGVVTGSNSRATIINSIISGNTDDLDGVAAADVSFTLIGDGTFATLNNNLTGDPRFVNAAGGNFRLQSNSPAIDRGSNAAIAGVTTDLAGNPRIVDGNRDGTATVDLGAYEFQ
ncbi:MAG: right-handed parallel beta-helix repeat-containing protein [Acidobacteriota bacterium]|nr:right-handed parallel beta-helix repeat-containing protein [Blastocatellia bacterium]MDW8240651.1 right-handed parallel beta-helix repeat-containing protein [Acidobacteriota bacterium]